MSRLHRRLLELVVELQAGDEMDRRAARWIQARIEQDQERKRERRWRKARLEGHGRGGEFYLDEEWLR